MPRHVWENEINEETQRAILEEIVLVVEHTSDATARQAAAKARTELWRREQEAWRERFNAESQERIKAQQFQLTEKECRMDGMAFELMDTQARVRALEELVANLSRAEAGGVR